MTLQECYAALGGDYESVLGRLHSDRLVEKFTLKFLDDPSFRLLEISLAAEDWQEAFRAAHTIKGVCQNLDFTALYRSSAALCEALRGGYHPEAPTLAEGVREDYRRTVSAIRDFQAAALG